MDDQQQRIEKVIIPAAASISIEIDKMMKDLPQNVDLAEIAFELVAAIADCSDNPALLRVFSDALAARQALIQMGVKLD